VIHSITVSSDEKAKSVVRLVSILVIDCYCYAKGFVMMAILLSQLLHGWLIVTILGFFRIIGYNFHSNIARDTDPILQLNIRGSYHALGGKDFSLVVVM
jgi:hypothetical protein